DDPEIKLRLFNACIVGLSPTIPTGRLFTIEFPAATVRFPELVIVPAFIKSCTASRVRFKLFTALLSPNIDELGRTDEITAPGWLNIFDALSVAVVTCGFEEIA